MSSAEDLGLDDRARAMLADLPIDKQNIALSKLESGLQSGKVRNASAYIIGVINGPDLLGLDENATKMLNELPSHLQKGVIDKLKKTEDVRNPSAWVAKAVLTAKRESPGGMTVPMSNSGHRHDSFRGGGGGGRGGGGGGGFGGGLGSQLLSLDASARSLLESLPLPTQQEIWGRLMTQSNVKNPSAWVAKAAMQAGATSNRGPSFDGFDPAVAQILRNGQGGQPISLDTGAASLLQSLPVEMQTELVGRLVMESNVKNPSGWMVKQCLAAGATTQPGQRGGQAHAPMHHHQQQHSFSQPQMMMHGAGTQDLDEGAKQMLAKLPVTVQQDILRKLSQTDVKNPSAWVVKSALQAGAGGGGGGGGSGGHDLGASGVGLAAAFGSVVGGLGGRAPVPAVGQPRMQVQPIWQLDQNALNLLATVPDHAQQDILHKLSNSFNEGKVQNPSGWVVKACMKAGAQTTPGLSVQGGGGASLRAAPY